MRREWRRLCLTACRPRRGPGTARTWAARWLLVCLTACSPSGVPIAAGEGGVVTSDDGAFTLRIPPRALAHDTAIAVRALTEDEWPARAPGRFELLGAVYAIEPAGLELREDAYAVLIPSRALDDEDGALLAVHYQHSSRTDEVAAAPVTRTVHLADGRRAVVATLFELGTHWVGDRVPATDRDALPALRARLAAEDVERADGDAWMITEAALTSDRPHLLFERAVTTTAVREGVSAGVVPAGDAEVRRWDATHDPALGLHALEVFDAPGSREETRVTIVDHEPVTLEADVTLTPALEPLPGWRCDGVGDARVFVELDVVTGASSGVVTVGLARELGAARCR